MPALIFEFLCWSNNSLYRRVETNGENGLEAEFHSIESNSNRNFVKSGFLCPALAEHTVFVVSVRNGSRRVRNGSQLTGVLWDLRLAGHTSATHTFLV